MQEYLVPIYHLTRKGIPFYWGEEQEKAFKAIKMHISDFLSRHPDNDTDSPNEIIPITFLARDICHVVTRSMSKKAEADIPTIYPLKGEHRKPEKAKQ